MNLLASDSATDSARCLAMQLVFLAQKAARRVCLSQLNARLDRELKDVFYPLALQNKIAATRLATVAKALCIVALARVLVAQAQPFLSQSAQALYRVAVLAICVLSHLADFVAEGLANSFRVLFLVGDFDCEGVGDRAPAFFGDEYPPTASTDRHTPETSVHKQIAQTTDAAPLFSA